MNDRVERIIYNIMDFEHVNVGPIMDQGRKNKIEILLEYNRDNKDAYKLLTEWNLKSWVALNNVQ